jgi:hypothetical protein
MGLGWRRTGTAQKNYRLQGRKVRVSAYYWDGMYILTNSPAQRGKNIEERAWHGSGVEQLSAALERDATRWKGARCALTRMGRRAEKPTAGKRKVEFKKMRACVAHVAREHGVLRSSIRRRDGVIAKCDIFQPLGGLGTSACKLSIYRETF